MSKSPFISTLKRVGLFFLIVFFSFVLLTPAYAINLLSPLEWALTKTFSQITFAKQAIAAYFQPLVVIFVNSVITPFLIKTSSEFEDYTTISSKTRSIIWRLFFFMLFNTLLLPISETSTALVLLKNIEDKGVTGWPTLLSSNLMAQQYFYIKFIIQLSFVTNGLALIAAPQRLSRWWFQKIHNHKQRTQLSPAPFEEVMEFDIGYNQSYCLVIFLNCLLFAPIVPIMTILATIYFYFKYNIDKYNLVFVFPKAR
mmetsp:Transcript_29859/g.45611  ORF Transcript_29859/g.45611 Transcript_29859/m.45611 type:complete len:255 (+) Transcript_29859:1483-2247(+)